MQFTATTIPEVQHIVHSVRKAQPAWASSEIETRVATLQAFKQAIQSVESELFEAMCEDCKRIGLSKLELFLLYQRIDHWCARAPMLCKLQETGISQVQPSVTYQQVYHPYPVVGCISPWNYPLTLSFADAIPALLAGCSVVLKPSEITPRFATPIRKAIHQVPSLQNIFAIVLGDGEVGKALIDEVDLICFTGSVTTGRKVAVQAASRLIPAIVELGGKDPLLVCEDVDIEVAARVIIRSSCAGSGQACQSIERVYIHHSIFQKVLEEIKKQIQDITSTATDPQNGTQTPFIHHPQATIVKEQIDEAIGQGAIPYSVGEWQESKGYHWCPITILTNVNHSMRIMQEETFGPVIPLMPFKSDEEAIALANDSEFGLSAAVLCNDQARAIAIAKQIKAGAISIHDAGLTTTLYDVEKNSFAQSGLGASRMGDVGLTRFFRKQALLFQTKPPIPLTMFKNQ
ncbi:MAG: aldehyde dehydrogenase family protein [Methylacidiphilales bacterium]|nr:aldehyde dehydrogenase family protein [Candidatus Methylacidiphilales bacterium]